MHKCAVMVKCSKENTIQQRVIGKGWIYDILGIFEGFDEDLHYLEQDNELSVLV